jgi:hypothetical protein
MALVIEDLKMGMGFEVGKQIQKRDVIFFAKLGHGRLRFKNPRASHLGVHLGMQRGGYHRDLSVLLGGFLLDMFDEAKSITEALIILTISPVKASELNRMAKIGFIGFPSSLIVPKTLITG